MGGRAAPDGRVAPVDKFDGGDIVFRLNAGRAVNFASRVPALRNVDLEGGRASGSVDFLRRRQSRNMSNARIRRPPK